MARRRHGIQASKAGSVAVVCGVGVSTVGSDDRASVNDYPRGSLVAGEVEGGQRIKGGRNGGLKCPLHDMGLRKKSKKTPLDMMQTCDQHVLGQSQSQ